MCMYVSECVCVCVGGGGGGGGGGAKSAECSLWYKEKSTGNCGGYLIIRWRADGSTVLLSSPPAGW